VSVWEEGLVTCMTSDVPRGMYAKEQTCCVTQGTEHVPWRSGDCRCGRHGDDCGVCRGQRENAQTHWHSILEGLKIAHSVMQYTLQKALELTFCLGICWLTDVLDCMLRLCVQVYTHANQHAGYYPGAGAIDIKLLFSPAVSVCRLS